MLFLLALFSDEPQVFLPKYSQTAILHAAHFQRVVKPITKEVSEEHWASVHPDILAQYIVLHISHSAEGLRKYDVIKENK